jgi:predicted RNA-binding Zn-ribbon protein involved in translation (DUF1610 family)
MNDLEINSLGISTDKMSNAMGAAGAALRACPSLPDDLYTTVVADWAKERYLIYSNKKKRGICTNCGFELEPGHFPLYSYISEDNRILKERVKAGLDPLDIYEMDIEDGVEPRAEDDPYLAAAVNPDFAALKSPENDGAYSQQITAHGMKYICPTCGLEVILLESGYGRNKYREEKIVTIPLVRDGKIYVLNLWTDVDYAPFGLPKVIHELRSLYVFSPDGNEYYHRTWTYDFGFTYVSSPVSRRTVHIPWPVRQSYAPSQRNQICFYSEDLDEKLRSTAWKYARWADLCCWIEKSDLRYRAWSELFLEYIFHYGKDPAVERLEQSGFTHLVFHYIEGRGNTRVLNRKQNTLTKIFGLSMPEIRQIRKSGAKFDVIGMYKFIRKLEGRRPLVTIEQAAELEKHRYVSDIRLLPQMFENEGVSFVRFLAWQRRQQAKSDDGAWIRLSDYFDYLNQCHTLNQDLTDRSVAYPGNFSAAHTRLSDIINEKNAAKEAKKYAKYAGKIKAAGEKIARRKTPFVRDGLLIRPAADAGEIAREGRLQHHCVASYIEGMCDGQYAIMFIRKESDPDTPYCTLQLSPRGTVMQNRGKFNFSVPDDVRAFVDKWLAEVINKPELKKKPSARSAVQPVMLPAAM